MAKIGRSWEVIKSLGQGSLGAVFLCRNDSGVLAAVKVLNDELREDEAAIARLRSEVSTAVLVRNENVVQYYEYFREGKTAGVALEYLANGDLSNLIDGPSQTPISDVVRILSQAANGLEAIHRSGILHRNIKPENLLLSQDGTVKISDFCMAMPKSTAGGAAGGSEEADLVVSSPDYLSPEYLEHGRCDQRSDIYAFGCVAYELLTKQLPFRGETVLETMTSRLRGAPPSPTIIRPDCPEELDRTILKCLSREPALRFQTAGEVRAALLAIDLKPTLH